MKERRKSKRRKASRRNPERRQPVRVRSKPGERNVLENAPVDELLSEDLDDLELSIEFEPEEGFDPYNH